MSDEDAPQTPSDPRPNGEPYYITTTCNTCGEDLVLYDSVSDDDIRQSDEFLDPELSKRDGEIWYDEWVCPDCLDGVYMDVPDDYFG